MSGFNFPIFKTKVTNSPRFELDDPKQRRAYFKLKAGYEIENPKQKKELLSFLKQRYRGFITIEQAPDIILGRVTKTLLPSEIILALVERQIDKLRGKALFIDGFPRNLDQISYSLYFR